MLTCSFRPAPSPSARTPRSRLSASHKSSHCSSSAPARSICARTRRPPSLESLAKAASRLAAWHSRLYPITTSLGIDGVKKIKRRTVQEHIHARAEELAPRPSENVWLPVDHQGHDLQGPILNTGFTTRNDEVIGSWVQPCNGCRRCSTRARGRKRVFMICPPLPADIRADPQLQRLLQARAELWPIQRGTAAAPPAVSSPSPTPAPASIPLPEPAVGHRYTPAATPPPPFRRTLHFDYGEYGGTHYSSDGYIIRRSPSSSTSSVNNESDDDVLLFTWYDTDKPPIQMTIQPRLQGLSGVCRGEIVLQDFQRGLEAVGLPVDIAIERFMDATDHWVITDWARAIPIYARNRVIYIKALGHEVTPPDHFIDLFD
ncbi:hypothetical protein C8R44DRAFT_753674 [Mycena epipterygia]|nr:hypothetical protein C8R44DRAFT_753674 [Mycena epipterygia]